MVRRRRSGLSVDGGHKYCMGSYATRSVYDTVTRPGITSTVRYSTLS
jgi:hypothetical protein